MGATAAEAQAQSIMRRWEADIKQYEAGQNHSFQVSKANADALVHAPISSKINLKHQL